MALETGAGMSRNKSDIAVIGIGCLFPDAANLDEYWRNIKQGHDAIGPIPLSHWRPEDYFDTDPKKPDHTYARTGGFLKPYAFDPLKFGIAPQTLEATDSTQLLGMVCAHEALVDAGYGPENKAFDRDRVSCIIGVTGTLELVIPLGARLGHPLWKAALDRAGVAPDVAQEVMDDIAGGYVPWQEASFPGLLWNVVAGRIASRLDLGGTNSVVDAACASSLAAVHMATMELQSGRADMVITGGMDTFNDIFMYMCFSKTPALSPTGGARPYDAEGDGTALGEGLGAVILKRLEDAERDGDRIYAVLRSVGSSSDGKGQAIYAPSAKGQVKALERAYEAAGVSPRTIELVEGHGTGTKVGDGVELEALTRVYRSDDAEAPWCRLGSVKSQIGHTKAAAGAAGLIKAVMALHHKVLPPTIKIHEPHPKLLQSPFIISDKARPWVGSAAHPRRAAVSAFGFGGSNYHAVLEEYSSKKSGADWDPDLQIIAVSGDEPEGVWKALERAQACLEQGMSPRDLGRSTRARFSVSAQHRLCFISSQPEQLQERLTAAIAFVKQHADSKAPLWLHYRSGPNPGKLAFIFAGQGSQEPGMLRDLACHFPEFLDSLEAGDQILRELEPKGPRLSDLIYPAQAFDESAKKEQRQQLTETRYAQLSLGTLGLATLELLKAFAVTPDALAGHSYGELLALHAAGVLSVRDLLKVSYQRGRLMKSFGKPKGAMLAVMASEAEIQKVLKEHGLDMEWANFNADKQIVLGADEDRCQKAALALKQAGIGSRRLEVSTAFHTSFVEAAVEPFQAVLEFLEFGAAQKLVYANTTAGVYPQKASEQKALLSRQIASPVRFSALLQNMQADGIRTFVEIGPQKKLNGLLKAAVGEDACLSLDSDSASSLQGLAQLLAQLASRGYPVNLSAWDFGPEVPPPAPKKNFTVTITGANYRKPRETPAKVRPKAQPQMPLHAAAPEQMAAAPNQALPNHASNQAAPNHAAQLPKSPHSEPTLSPFPESMPKSPSVSSTKSQPIAATRFPQEGTMSSSNDSFQRLEKVMQDMHEIQRKTADAHTLFLENQRQFQSLLQGMLIGSPEALPRPQAAQPVAQRPVAPTPAAQPQPVAVSRPAVQTQAAAQAQPVPHIQPAPTPAVAAPKPEVKAEAPVKTEQTSSQRVYAVLSQCTGYPSELLQPEMNLEADLGIDSIKKVEIFSQLQSQQSGLDGDASRLGELQTIADLLALTAAQTSAVTPSVPVMEERVGAWAAGHVALAAATPAVDHQVILQVVSEKTGFPLSMLQAEMELEADLGIDSIKKVEIFSVVQERLPQLANLGAEELNGLRHISDLFALLGSAPQVIEEELLDITRLMSHSDDDKVWQVLSDKTGYPREVLTAEMSLEGDLGIDSIKRVEIFSGVAELIPSLQTVSQEAVAELQTVGDLLQMTRQALGQTEEQVERSLLEPDQGDWDLSKKKNPTESSTVELDQRPGAYVGSSLNAGDLVAALNIEDSESAESEFFAEETSDQNDRLQGLQLSRLEAEIFPHGGTARSWQPGTEVWIGDDGSNLARNIMLKLQERGLHARLVSLAQADRLQIPEQLHGLILLAPLKLEVPPVRWLGYAFKLLRKCGPALQVHADQSLVGIVTRHGARFGLDGLQSNAQVYGGALAAFAKTVAEEWPGIHSRALDLGRDFTDGIEAALRCLDGLLLKGPVELGVNRDQIFQLALHAQNFSADLAHHELIKPNDLILVTGGARGVTAASLLPLAQHWRPRFVIWGRTPLTAAEPSLFHGITDAAVLKRSLMTFNPELKSPRDLEAAYRQLIQERELRANIEQLESAGARVHYEAVDVSKEAELRTAFTRLVQEHGVPAGILHGAGVIRDKWILDQKDEEFFEVLDTKLRILPFIEDCAKQGLRWAFLYSSSTARLGRKGQVAYGVANEALNKFAQFLSSNYPDCYALAFNWGPWSGGMVNDGLKKIFAAEGVATIPLATGAALVRRTLEYPQRQVHELMVLAQDAAELSAPHGQARISGFAINVNAVPILLDHVIKQRAVVPAALLLEWMAVAAQSLHPELALQKVRDFQVWKGIVLDADQNINAWVEKIQDLFADGQQHVDLVLMSVNAEGKTVRHARAQLQLGDAADQLIAIPQAALAEDPLCQGLRPYTEILFHGENLQPIDHVRSCTAEGLDARISLHSHPADWSQDGVQSAWMIHGEAVDAIFQAAIIWSSLQQGRPCLPAKIGHLEIFQPLQSASYSLRFRLNRLEHMRLIAQADLVNEQGELVLRLENFEAVLDAGLAGAFRQTRLLSLDKVARPDLA